ADVDAASAARAVRDGRVSGVQHGGGGGAVLRVSGVRDSGVQDREVSPSRGTGAGGRDASRVRRGRRARAAGGERALVSGGERSGAGDEGVLVYQYAGRAFHRGWAAGVFAGDGRVAVLGAWV